MSNFNNHVYQSLVTDIIGDTFYKNTSVSGRISFVRRYAEVVIRKILDVDSHEKIMLGQRNLRTQIRDLPDYEFVERAIENIRNNGNKAIHTEYLEEFSEEDFKHVVNALFDLFAYLFIRYFEKYEFGSRNDILYSFSMLPPIIRYKVLSFLYEKNPNNIAIVDKLVLSIMKAFSVEEAEEWIEKSKNILIKMKTVSDSAFKEMSEKYGIMFAKCIKSEVPENMYKLCKMKILKVGGKIKDNGVLYSDFESALPYYKEQGILEGNEEETVEFNDIMEFLYLGRKEKIQETINESESYMILNFI